MVKSCCAYNCKNVWSPNQNIQYHRFPLKSPDLLQQWIKATRLENFHPNPYTVICSQHFKAEDYSDSTLCKKRLKPNVVPSVFNFPSYYQEKKSKRRRLECTCEEFAVEVETVASTSTYVSKCFNTNIPKKGQVSRNFEISQKN